MAAVRNLEFGPSEEGSLRMDLHLPDGGRAGPWPVVVWLHGGGWREGTRATAPRLPLEHGYAVAAIDYRLTTEAAWPAQLEDCREAVIYVRRHAHKHQLDPRRIAVWGKSAGGHLAAMLAVLSGTPEGREADWRVQAACDYSGPSELESFARPDWRERYRVLGGLIDALLDGPIEDRREMARQASPLLFASSSCAPLRIAHGDRDDVVPLEQSERLFLALREAGADVELEVVRGKGHHIASLEMDRRTLDFLDRVLGRESE